MRIASEDLLLNVLPRMIRILQLLDFHADFENESIADVLRDGLGGDYQVDRHRLRDNPAGMISAIARLRKIRKNYDVAHAFSSRALMAAAALDVRIIYSPARFPTCLLYTSPSPRD